MVIVLIYIAPKSPRALETISSIEGLSKILRKLADKTKLRNTLREDKKS